MHGFLTVNGQKMSKSLGTFINARDYLYYLNPEYLRYYIASKLCGGIVDLDFQLEDFDTTCEYRAGKLVNIEKAEPQALLTNILKVNCQPPAANLNSMQNSSRRGIILLNNLPIPAEP